MDEKTLREIALFKFSLIAPVVNNTYEGPSKSYFFRELAKREHLLPTGKTERFAADTFKNWYLDYKHDNFNTLVYLLFISPISFSLFKAFNLLYLKCSSASL